MADNVSITAGSGTVIAADDVTSVFYQRVKLDIGGDGATVPVVGGQLAAAASIPVVLASDETLGGAVKAEDAAHTTGDKGIMALGVRNDAGTTMAGTDGDYIPLSITGGGALRVSASGAVTVSGAVSIGGTTAVSGIVSIGGTTAVSGSVTATLAAGTAAFGKLSANTGVDIGDVDVTSINGFVAHDTAVSGAPLLSGFEARTSDGTAVASGDAVRGQADTLGKQVVVLGSVHDLRTSGILNMTTVGPTTCIATVGATTKIAVTSVLVTNSHATVGTKVEIRANATAKIKGYAAPAGGGFALNAGGAPLFVTAVNEPIRIACVTTGADVDVTVSGYTLIN